LPSENYQKITVVSSDDKRVNIVINTFTI